MQFSESRYRKQHLAQRLVVLQRIEDSVGRGAIRPCARCNVACRCAKHSSSCACICRRDCTLAPRMLSSDDKSPIEPNVFALTYEINASGVGQSCWSCEGHADERGNLSRAPAVWFYAEHVAGVELLTRHVQHLEDFHKLRHPWRVTALLVGKLEIDCPTFALAPLVEVAEEAGPPRSTPAPQGILAELRSDMEIIAGTLLQSVHDRARHELQLIRAELR